MIAGTIKRTSARAIATLRRMGLRTVLVTGDNTRAAHAVASQAGIGEVIAGVLPEAKFGVRGLQQPAAAQVPARLWS